MQDFDHGLVGLLCAEAAACPSCGGQWGGSVEVAVWVVVGCVSVALLVWASTVS